MKQNSYSYMNTGKVAGALIGLLVSFFAFLLWYIFAVEFCVALFDVALKSTVNLTRILTGLMVIGTLVGMVIISVILIGGYNIHTITVSNQGVELMRRKGSITITRIKNLEEPNPNVLRLTGVKTDGKPFSKRFVAGYIGKKNWENFKNNLRGFWQQQK
ncbi:MAG: hypothetical protein KJ655_06335 [Candidatus Thermoplasmatota archaeon]|nr:hypothetical protein [Candidatus Thermoplasmatota archaeon]